MNAPQWQQDIVVKPVQKLTPSSINICSSSKDNNSLGASGGGGGKKAAGTVVRPPKEQPIPCPRCNSTSTKFCYYNNYSLTQPRYFCKRCRRYWTEGGSLRNIPVGGCSRKNKRSPSSSSAGRPAVGAKKPFVLPPLLQNSNSMTHQSDGAGQDLNLSFPNHHQDYRSMSNFVHLPNTSTQTNASASASESHLSALELLTGMTSRGVGGGVGFSNNFMPISSDPDSVYASVSFTNFMHDFRPQTLNFSLDNGAGQSTSGVFGTSTHNDQISTTTGGGGGRVLVSPFDILKNQQADHHNHHHHHHHHHQHQHQHQQQVDHNNRGNGVSTGYWSTELLGSGGGGTDW